MEYRDMVEYVNEQTGRVLKAVEALSAQMQMHETWHRTSLEEKLANVSNVRWQARALKVAVASCILSSASAIALVIGHVKLH